MSRPGSASDLRLRLSLVIVVALLSGLSVLAWRPTRSLPVLGSALTVSMAVAWLGGERLLLRQVRLAHAQMELHVSERTAQLRSANEALYAEVAYRRRAEANLQKLSRAIEQAGDSIFVTDCDGVIEYVNPSFEKLTGYSRAEVVGQTPRLFSSGRHTQQFYANVWRTLMSGFTFRAIFVNRTKGGRLYHEDQTVTPLKDAAGRITHFVSTGRDVTQRKRTEQALRRLNDSLEHEATRIAGVLHDQAGQFLTMAHITLAEVARDLPPAARDRLQDVRQNLNQVEDELRRLSHELHPRILTDLGLADALTFLAEGVTRRTGIAIKVETALAQRCPLHVEVAVYRLVQEALTNMAKHAKATRGSVVVEQDGNTVSCFIRDDGVGFDAPVTLVRAGQPGLGLVGIQDRLEAVGGMLTVTSAPGAGTELRAIVPLEMPDATPSAAGR